MRVISGKYRMRRLISPKTNDVRPTTDRIKETMFNILCNRLVIDDSSVLDLFCGSGALGLEALSRGAKTAVFVDKSSDSVELTRLNLAKTDEVFELYNTDARVALRKLDGREFDIIFLDPPYDSPYDIECAMTIGENKILSQNGVMIIEHSAKKDLLLLEKYFIIDTRKCGETSLSFLKYKQ